MNIEKVIEENKGLVIDIANSFYKRNRDYDVEDLIQTGYLSVINSIGKYNKKRGMLSTFLTHCIKNDLIKYTQSNSTNFVSINNIPENKLVNSGELSVDEFLDEKDSVFNQVIKMRMEKVSDQKIADSMNIKLSKVKKIKTKFLKRIEANK